MKTTLVILILNVLFISGYFVGRKIAKEMDWYLENIIDKIAITIMGTALLSMTLCFIGLIVSFLICFIK